MYYTYVHAGAGLRRAIMIDYQPPGCTLFRAGELVEGASEVRLAYHVVDHGIWVLDSVGSAARLLLRAKKLTLSNDLPIWR